MSLYTNIRGIILFTPWLIHLLLADILLSALLLTSILFPIFTYDTCSLIAASVWLAVQRIFTYCNNAQIQISGDSLPPGESAIVIANHISWTDFHMIQELAIRSGMLGRCRWFAKQELKWVPFLGWGLWAMGMPLVTRNWTRDRRQLDSIFGRIRDEHLPIWLVSYSEGARYTNQLYRESEAWCKKSGREMPQHLLYPRNKGFVAQVQELKRSKHVKAVYDCTIVYTKGNSFMQAPDQWEALSEPRLDQKYQFRIHVKRWPLEDVPSEEEEIGKWLEARWMEKGELLDQWSQGLILSNRPEII